MQDVTTSSRCDKANYRMRLFIYSCSTSPDLSGPAIKFILMKCMAETYRDLVFRTAFRIMCDRPDAESIVEKVFMAAERNAYVYVPLQSEEMENMLIRRTCQYSRLRIFRRRLGWLLGEHRSVFVRVIPEIADQDDYTVKQAWQLYCRACFKMTPLQIIVYALSELDCMSVERTASILGRTTFRVSLALSRAVRAVRNELSLYGSESQYHAYVAFIRKVH